ncbi:MAG TPA: trypsin-like peptidase domain-containing protein [Vicinamibacterales bacterium]
MSARTCPSCARRVPPSVMVCRCGYEWTGFEPETAEAPARRRTGLWLGPVVGVLALAGAGLLARQALRSGDVSRPVGQPVAETMTPDVQPVESPVEPEAAPAAPRTFEWPADLAIWKEAPSDEPSSAAPAAATPAARPATLEDVIAQALPAVVLVQTPAGRGTGFFVAADTVVTNAHVVDGHSYVTLRLANGASLNGRVLRTEDSVDLAAIHITDARPGQAVLTLSTEPVRVGQEVIAIGSPLGLQNTVTRGIVSALRRAGAAMLVQTDAAINPGNSGGPLLNGRGHVVAVATMRARAEALGFGVAAQHVRELLEGRRTPVETRAARPHEAMATDTDHGVDAERESAQAAYERFLVSAAQRADQLDRSWTDFVRDCLGGRAPSTRGDRGWFALLERFDESQVPPGCVRFYADFRFAAQQFTERMVEAAEQARRGGVYPGVCRQLRQRHRVDWVEW